MTPETCVQVSEDFARAVLQMFDGGMFLGAVIFFAGWIIGGGAETLIDMYDRLKAKL